jgi:hypothetical protein
MSEDETRPDRSPAAPGADSPAPPEPRDASSSDQALFGTEAVESFERPRWRAPLLVGVLIVMGLVAFWFAKDAQQPRRFASLCFQAMFVAQKHYTAALALAEYRKEAGDEIPAEVHDEVYRLRTQPYAEQHPLVHDTMDPHLIANAAFFSLASDSALQGAQTLQEAAKQGLRYVSLRVQADAIREGESVFPVGSIHALYRGHGTPSQLAWILADLLRCRGIHACVVQLPPTPPAKRVYFLTGVLIGRHLHLLDPHRGVPLCRAHDGRVARLAGLLAGSERLAPGFGGPGTPATVDALRRASYLVPAGPGNILPDAWLLQKIVNDNGRHDVIYRSFRRDLRQLAAVVFGTGGKEMRTFGGDYVTIRASDRQQVCALWPFPFQIGKLGQNPDYVLQLARSTSSLRAYQEARSEHLFGQYKAALRLYDEAAAREDLPEGAAEDIAFLRASITPTPEDRAERLGRYLNDYAKGRWRPLATFHLATLYAETGQFQPAIELAAQLEGPYGLIGSLIRQAAEDGKRRIVWSFPDANEPVPMTTAPARATPPSRGTSPASSGVDQ